MKTFVLSALSLLGTSLAALGHAQESAIPVVQAVASPSATASTSVLDRRISLHLNHVTLRDALTAISTKAHVTLAYSRAEVPVANIITVDASDISLREALATVLANTNIVAMVRSTDQIALGPRLGANALDATQNTATVTGVVTDSATNAALAGVTVHVEGTDLTTHTSNTGKYTITGVAAGTVRISAHRVGYITKALPVTLADGQSSTLNFQVVQPPTKLDEVVTTAVGDQRRYQVGNVISTINVDSLAPTAPVTSVTDILSGRIPGLNVTEQSGMVGQGESIRIRGTSSVLLQGDPILIVDGMRQDDFAQGSFLSNILDAGKSAPNRMDDIDYSDIETIDVLKGPAATTEYGTDAANGVIVITTKHGKAGQTLWHADGEDDLTGLANSFPKMYYSWGHLTNGTNAAANVVQPYFGSGEYEYHGCTVNPAPYTTLGQTAGTCVVDSITQFDPLNNSQTSLFRTGQMHKYDLSVSGGTETIKYFLSGGGSTNNGPIAIPPIFKPLAAQYGVTLPPSAYNPNDQTQLSFRFNSTMKVSQALDVQVNAAYLMTNEANTGGSYLLGNVYDSPAINDISNMYGYNGGGYAGGAVPGQYNDLYSTPFQALDGLGVNDVRRLTGGMTTTWRPNGWFTGVVTAGIDHGDEQDQDVTYPLGTATNTYVPGLGGLVNDYSYLAYAEGTTDIYTLDARGSVKVNLTQSIQSTTSAGLQIAKNGQFGTTASGGPLNIFNESLQAVSSTYAYNSQTVTATLGGYLEEQIALSERLFLIGALRVDGSSGFGSQYVMQAYPKISFSWLAIDGATSLRFRGAVGGAGEAPNNGASDLLFQSCYEGDPYNGTTRPCLQMSSPGNPVLKPENSTEYETGLDLNAFNNRLSVEATVYYKHTSNLLTNLSYGGDAGSFVEQTNLGSVENDGEELVTTAALIQNRSLEWDVTLNASMNHNKLLQLNPGNIATGFAINGYISFQQQFVNGYPLYGLFAFPMTYADANHDGIIEPNEVHDNPDCYISDGYQYGYGTTPCPKEQYQGPSIPTELMSLSSHFGLWRNTLFLNMMFDWKGGYKIQNNVAIEQDQVGNSYYVNSINAPLWQQARSMIQNPYNFYSLQFENGDFLRFRELSLTYNLPRTVARALHIVDNMSVTGSVRNVYLWTTYTDVDPETVSAPGNAFYNTVTGYNGAGPAHGFNGDVRIDVGAVPLPRDFIFRINLGLK